MVKILVIADDLTGAAEMGGIVYRAGLSAMISLSGEVSPHLVSDAVIIDSNTRDMRPGEAARKIGRITRNAAGLTFSFLYKKVDSLLRGQVAPEINEMLSVLGIHTAVLIPANPSRNRTIQNGLYLVDGVRLDKTEFSHDPSFPRKSAEVRKMVGEEANIRTGPFVPGSVDGNVNIPDVSTINDIERITGALPDKGILRAGGADFFSVLLQEKLPQQTNSSPPACKISGRRHFILGSHTEISRRSHELFRRNGYRIIPLPSQAAGDHAVVPGWLQMISAHVRSGDSVVVTSPVNPVTTRKGREHIKLAMTEAAKTVVASSFGECSLFIEGGGTASAYCRGMKYETLRITGVHADGVVSLSPDDVNKITIKPGSYDWPAGFFENPLNLLQP